MTENDDHTHDQSPTRQAIAAQNRSLPGRVTGRLRAAINAMVWEGTRRKDAAAKAGMTDHSLRTALRKPHVIAFYREELGILRESERAKTLNRLCELRDQNENRAAAVNAAKALEQISDAAPPSGGVQRAPGITIVIGHAPDRRPVIDVTPALPTAAPDDVGNSE